MDTVWIQATILQVGRDQVLLGGWWLGSLGAGLVPATPLTNLCPKMAERLGCSTCGTAHHQPAPLAFGGTDKGEV